MSKRLVLIDGHAILHRAYHALPPLTSRSGELVNAVYGFCTILLKVIDDLKPQYLAVAFDTPKPIFRQDIFIGYQVQRPRMEAELAGQIEKVQKMLSAFGIPFFAIPGYEADDLIGTIAKKAKNLKTIIVSGDRDLFQLVNKKVKLYVPIYGLSEAQLFGGKEVRQKMGVEPAQIIDYKGLVGDASDNYPGVSGIGPKTAVSLLQRFGTLEKIYKSIDKIENESLKRKLLDGRESAELSKRLATVVINVPLDLEIENLRLKDLKTREAIEVLNQLGFRSLVVRITGGVRVRDRDRVKEEEKVKQGKLF